MSQAISQLKRKVKNAEKAAESSSRGGSLAEDDDPEPPALPQEANAPRVPRPTTAEARPHRGRRAVLSAGSQEGAE